MSEPRDQSTPPAGEGQATGHTAYSVLNNRHKSGYVYVLDGERWPVARVMCATDPMAVAQLFAAAPELLAAIDRLVGVVEDVATELCEQDEYARYFNRKTGEGWQAVQQARTAVAKARGQGQ